MMLRAKMQERRAPEAEFEEQRRLTFGIAYRMTGSVSDAEDIGQEAFVRLERARRDGETPDSPKAWLSTVTTRLAIDHMRSARARRESYVGPWLPEPLLTDEDDPGPAEHAEVTDTVSQAFLVLLETLSPVERAVFLLRDVFGYEYSQIADAVGKEEENCRQIAARARKHVEGARSALRGGPRARRRAARPLPRGQRERRRRGAEGDPRRRRGRLLRRRRQGHGGAAALLRHRPDRPLHGENHPSPHRGRGLPADAGPASTASRAR